MSEHLVRTPDDVSAVATRVPGPRVV